MVPVGVLHDLVWVHGYLLRVRDVGVTHLDKPRDVFDARSGAILRHLFFVLDGELRPIEDARGRVTHVRAFLRLRSRQEAAPRHALKVPKRMVRRSPSWV